MRKIVEHKTHQMLAIFVKFYWHMGHILIKQMVLFWSDNSWMGRILPGYNILFRAISSGYSIPFSVIDSSHWLVRTEIEAATSIVLAARLCIGHLILDWIIKCERSLYTIKDSFLQQTLIELPSNVCNVILEHCSVNGVVSIVFFVDDRYAEI